MLNGVLKVTLLFLSALLFSTVLCAQNTSITYVVRLNDSLRTDLITPAIKQRLTVTDWQNTTNITLQKNSYYVATVNFDSTANTLQIGLYNNLTVRVIAVVDSTNNDSKVRFFSWKDCNTFIQLQLSSYDNSGYPFATIQLQNSILNNDTLTTSLVINKGAKNHIDSLLITPINSINYNLLTHILNLRKGNTYNQSAINDIEKRINKLGFIQLKNAPVVEFISPTVSLLKLNVQPVKNNEAEALIGFLPDNNTGKILFTGYANFKLNNALKYAEQFIVRWKRNQPQVQELTTQAMVPHIAGSPLGANANLQIYKRDSTFLNTQYGVGGTYRFTYTNYVQLYYQRKSNNSLTKTTISEQYLPNTQTNLYGLKFAVDETNYALNPIKGVVAEVSVASGLRKLAKSKNNFSQLDANISTYVPIIKKWVLHQKIIANTIFSDSIYAHELFRTGGVKSMRGFNDESIFSSSILQSTTELRYILGKNANLFALYDIAYLENKSTLAYKNNNGLLLHQLLQATGIGLNIDTKTGIFTLIYALGKQNNNSFDLRTGKLHIGFNVLF